MLPNFKYAWKIAVCAFILSLVVTGCANAPQPAASSEVAATSTTAPAAEPAAATDTPAPVVAEVAATEAPKQETTNSESQAAAAGKMFVIDSAQSKARYNIFEELRGAPKTVEGVSTLEGSVTLDPANLASASISTITIDARAFKTDSTMRDGAVRRFILGSNNDDYRYITFTPTAISGLPASAAVGETISFQVTGDMKIYETTKPVTFAMTVTATSETEITGSGTTTVLRSDFGLTIPSVPSVANVADEVPLFIDFVAKTN